MPQEGPAPVDTTAAPATSATLPETDEKNLKPVKKFSCIEIVNETGKLITIYVEDFNAADWSKNKTPDKLHNSVIEAGSRKKIAVKMAGDHKNWFYNLTTWFPGNLFFKFEVDQALTKRSKGSFEHVGNGNRKYGVRKSVANNTISITVFDK